MSSKNYLGFIAFFVKNTKHTMLNMNWPAFFKKVLGTTDFNEVATSKLRELALRMYYTHFIALILKTDRLKLLESKTSAELRELLVSLEKFLKRANLPELQVVYYTDDSKAIEHMEKLGESIKILEEVTEEKIKPKTAKSKAAKAKTTKPKAATKSTARKSPPKKAPIRKSPAKVTISKGKKCEDYKILELKKLAQEKDIKGRSSMNKADLCRALKIK